jgi:hypothetical protein
LAAAKVQEKKTPHSAGFFVSKGFGESLRQKQAIKGIGVVQGQLGDCSGQGSRMSLHQTV